MECPVVHAELEKALRVQGLRGAFERGGTGVERYAPAKDAAPALKFGQGCRETVLEMREQVAQVPQ